MLYTAQLSAADRACRPAAYDATTFTCQATKCPAPSPTLDATSSASHSLTATPTANVSYSLDPMLAFVNRIAFTSCPASFVPTLPSLGSLAILPNLFASPLRSFTTSIVRPDSGLRAQPLANVWLSIDPGLPSLALTLPNLNPSLVFFLSSWYPLPLPYLSSLRSCLALLLASLPAPCNSMSSSALNCMLHRSSVAPCTSTRFCHLQPPPPTGFLPHHLSLYLPSTASILLFWYPKQHTHQPQLYLGSCCAPSTFSS